MAGIRTLAVLAAAAATFAGPAFAQAPAAQAPAAPAPAAQTAAQTPGPMAPVPLLTLPGDDAGLVDRGAYLARAADCMPCHSGDPKKPYAGNLSFNTPFGVMYSVNITSDPTYGIGTWTFEDFKGALHNGIRADGAYLYPAMPFDAYTGIPEDDLKALWAFVRRIPPIPEPRKPNELGFPFNVRLGLLAWRELFFDAAYWQPTAGKSAEWNRGSYLVEALGHCSDCHTPRNLMGAVKAKEHFLGADIDGFWAPAIDTATLTKDGWTRETLTQFFTNGSVPGKTEVFGPMAEVVRDSLAYLTPADRAALVTYLLDSPPPKDVPAPQAASPLPPDVFQSAAKLYIDNCAPCHQSKGTGSSDVVPTLAGNPAVISAEPYNVIMAVLGGLPAGGTYGPMPSFAGRLDDQQVANLVNYVRTAWHNGGAANATPAMVAAWRATANVPDYGTQQASAFDCPKVGGAPGANGPDPDAVAALSKMMQGGERETHVLISAYQNDDSDASAGTVVDALTAAYCPVVAQSQRPDWQKAAELQRFTLQVAAAISERLAGPAMPPVSIIWASPTGASLVARQPTSIAAKLTCPDVADGKLVPKALVDAATTLVGKPAVPVSGDAASRYATALMQQSPKARRSDVANALISAYCPLVVAKPNSSVAEQYSLLTGFGQQVVQTLQLGAPMFNAAKK
ncbi:c-type cytochrome [Aquabacter spiritensis]|uniref:Mono/diheme cytochrome c family protein n=1 Tax=Aquabacter spiritensis TaxID=933073 RepID=A0A4R3M0S8_9HYPH|nr:cytochrome c [Aquabacter spiritensis]TCT06640.1 mono/diheme cytochrome c family protein [Aquabacter spiritensis]